MGPNSRLTNANQLNLSGRAIEDLFPRRQNLYTIHDLMRVARPRNICLYPATAFVPSSHANGLDWAFDSLRFPKSISHSINVHCSIPWPGIGRRNGLSMKHPSHPLVYRRHLPSSGLSSGAHLAVRSFDIAHDRCRSLRDTIAYSAAIIDDNH